MIFLRLRQRVLLSRIELLLLSTTLAHTPKIRLTRHLRQRQTFKYQINISGDFIPHFPNNAAKLFALPIISLHNLIRLNNLILLDLLPYLNHLILPHLNDPMPVVIARSLTFTIRVYHLYPIDINVVIALLWLFYIKLVVVLIGFASFYFHRFFVNIR